MKTNGKLLPADWTIAVDSDRRPGHVGMFLAGGQNGADLAQFQQDAGASTLGLF